MNLMMCIIYVTGVKEVTMSEKEVVIERLLNRRKEIQVEQSELMDEDIKLIVELHNLGKVIEGYEIPF